MTSRGFQNYLASSHELRRKISNPDNVLIRFNVRGEIDEIQRKTLAFIQIQLTGIAYLPDEKQWDIVEDWVLSCPMWSEVKRYNAKVSK